MPNGGFKINKRGIRQISQQIEKEFAKNPVSIPLEADGPVPPPSTVVNNHGPVIHGDINASALAWDSGQASVDNAAADSGRDELAAVLERLLEQMPREHLAAEDVEDLEDAGGRALEAVRAPEPDEGRVQRGLRALRRVLEPIARGAQSGAAAGAQSWAREAVQSLPPA